METLSTTHTCYNEPFLPQRLFHGINQAAWLSWNSSVLAPNRSETASVPEVGFRRVLTIERNDGTPVLTIDKREEKLRTVTNTDISGKTAANLEEA